MKFKEGIATTSANVDKAVDAIVTNVGTIVLRHEHLKTLKDKNLEAKVQAVQVDHNALRNLEGAPEEITGAFSADHNMLKSLKGAPRKVGAYFSVSDNKTLTSLEGGPDEVTTSYYCSNTGITSFKGICKVGTSIYATNCKLTSLEGLKSRWLEELDVSDNELTSLKGLPEDINNLDASGNKLTSLEGLSPHAVECNLRKNKTLTSLEGIGTKYLKSCKELNLQGCPITKNALGLVLIHGLERFLADFKGSEIIHKYIGGGHDAVIDCQHELIEAGYEDLAEL